MVGASGVPGGAVAGGAIDGDGADPNASSGIPAPEPAPVPHELLAEIRDRISRAVVYPLLARRQRWQGRALIAFRLRKNGAVSELRIVSSSGFPVLDESALDAVRTASLPAGATDLSIAMPVVFQLR